METASSSQFRVAVVVQARMSSRRLPGKVLLPLGGKPVLAHALERLRAGQSWPVVVATSGHPSDDPLAAFCAGLGVACLRGPLDNVAARFLLAAQRLELDAFVRVCGDSPLIDPALVGRAVELFLEHRPDLVTNVHPRSFPRGQSVEVVSVETFRRALPDFSAPEEQEHVTLHFYRQAPGYRIVNFAHPVDLSDLRLVVDDDEDLKAMEDLIAGLARPLSQCGLEELATSRRRTDAARPREARVA